MRSLSQARIGQAPVWKQEVLAIIRNRWGDGREFFLPELYEAEGTLAQLHPGNKNIRPKIRQSLQYLRDERIVEFLDDRGSYRLRSVFLVRARNSSVPAKDRSHA